MLIRLLMKKLPVVLLIAATASMMASVIAAPKTLSAKAATPLVFNFLGATGCPDDETVDPKRFVKYSDASLKISGYVATVAADTGCAGGSGTVGSTLVFLRMPEGRDRAEEDVSFLRVDAEMSQPIVRVNNSPRAVTSLYQKGGQLFATGLLHGKDDANCCPSIKTLYKVSLQKKSVTVARDDIRDMYTWVFSPVK